VVVGGALLSTYVFAGSAAASQAAQNPPTRVLDDPSVEHGLRPMPHAGSNSISGYLARPKAEGSYPAVLVIAGNRISEEYIPNTCAALAKAGFVGLAPDVFHPLPSNTPASEYGRYLDDHTELNMLDDIQVGASYLRSLPFVSERPLAILGFCRGGREAIVFAVRSREIGAVIAYHPGPLALNAVSHPAPMAAEAADLIDVPVLVHHGTADTAVDVAHSRALVAKLRRRKLRVRYYEYEGAEHGFLAYTRPFYRPDHAVLSWRRSIRFLRETLGKSA
jgi:carboxymethylenebutenolidase